MPLAFAPAQPAAAPPRYHLIAQVEPKHNHGSCVVECPDGRLLACWYRGSGERTADDVVIMGARFSPSTGKWSAPFLMADTRGFPDCNPCMTITRDKRLLLFWPTILDNQWESALLNQWDASRFMQRSGSPAFDMRAVVLLKPDEAFGARVKAALPAVWEPYRAAAGPEDRAKLDGYLADVRAKADRKLSVRMGWMPRAHPTTLRSGRIILPLYSDGFDFSMMALSDDQGRTWSCSRPIVGAGAVQPSVVERRDGSLAAYFRDNGPPPQRVMAAESADQGLTWTTPRDIDVPDPGAGLEAVRLASGRWILVNNDTESGRHRLAVHLSDDEGRTWRLARYLERDELGPAAGSYGYPSVIQARNGTLHATYRYGAPDGGSAIKHAAFTEAWLLEGAAAR